VMSPGRIPGGPRNIVQGAAAAQVDAVARVAVQGTVADVNGAKPMTGATPRVQNGSAPSS
jgi:hypothetical protein